MAHMDQRTQMRAGLAATLYGALLGGDDARSSKETCFEVAVEAVEVAEAILVASEELSNRIAATKANETPIEPTPASPTETDTKKEPKK